MYSTIDLPELKRMADLAEAAEHFCMSQHLNWCGTSGCLLGTWSINTPNDRYRIIVVRSNGKRIVSAEIVLDGIVRRYPGRAAADRFRLPLRVVEFLFYSHRHRLYPDLYFDLCSSATGLTKAEAVARLEPEPPGQARAFVIAP